MITLHPLLRRHLGHLLPSATIALLCTLPLPASARTVDSAELMSARTRREEALRMRWMESRRIGTYSATAQHLYENADYGFAIRYPRDWTVQALTGIQGRITSVALFLSPLSEGDQAQENVNLVVEEHARVPQSASQYTETVIEQVQNVFADVQLRSSHDLLLAGEFGHEIRYDATFDGSRLAFEQIWAFHDGRIYVWTLATPLETVDAYRPVFHDMLSTFSFD